MNQSDNLLTAIREIDSTLLTVIEETCVPFNPVLCPEIILLLSGQKPRDGQHKTEQYTTFIPFSQPLDEHELALAEY